MLRSKFFPPTTKDAGEKHSTDPAAETSESTSQLQEHNLTESSLPDPPTTAITDQEQPEAKKLKVDHDPSQVEEEVPFIASEVVDDAKATEPATFAEEMESVLVSTEPDAYKGPIEEGWENIEGGKEANEEDMNWGWGTKAAANDQESTAKEQDAADAPMTESEIVHEKMAIDNLVTKPDDEEAEKAGAEATTSNMETGNRLAKDW